MNLFWDVGETEKELLESFVVKVRAWRVLLLGRDSKLDRKRCDMTHARDNVRLRPFQVSEFLRNDYKFTHSLVVHCTFVLKSVCPRRGNCLPQCFYDRPNK